MGHIRAEFKGTYLVPTTQSVFTLGPCEFNFIQHNPDTGDHPC